MQSQTVTDAPDPVWVTARIDIDARGEVTSLRLATDGASGHAEVELSRTGRRGRFSRMLPS